MGREGKEEMTRRRIVVDTKAGMEISFRSRMLHTKSNSNLSHSNATVFTLSVRPYLFMSVIYF